MITSLTKRSQTQNASVWFVCAKFICSWNPFLAVSPKTRKGESNEGEADSVQGEMKER